MTPQIAAIAVAIDCFDLYCDRFPHDQLEKIKPHLLKAKSLLEEYYQVLHSIHWHKSRKAIRESKEAELENLAKIALSKIDLAGKLLDYFADNNQIQEDFWSEIIKHLILCRNWIETNYLLKDRKYLTANNSVNNTRKSTTAKTGQLALF